MCRQQCGERTVPLIYIYFSILWRVIVYGLRRSKSVCRKVIAAVRFIFLCMRGALWCFIEIISIAVPALDKDFLIEYLSAYVQSDEYLARTAAFEEEFGKDAQPFAVTYAFELKLDGWGSENQPLHFFMVKANCDSFVDGGGYDSVTMAIDYDTGTVYDQFSVDESWMEKSEKEQAIYIAAEGGCFGDVNYNGEPIFVDSETHIPLSDSDIVEINQALSK